MAFHAGVTHVTGGFLGVDVFFCLSGFLITSLLLGEARHTGTIRLGAFWARRARRLLPCALPGPVLRRALRLARRAPRGVPGPAARLARHAPVRRELALHPGGIELLPGRARAVASDAHLVPRDRGAVLPRVAARRPRNPEAPPVAGDGARRRRRRRARVDGVDGVAAPRRRRPHAPLLRHRHPRDDDAHRRRARRGARPRRQGTRPLVDPSAGRRRPPCSRSSVSAARPCWP